MFDIKTAREEFSRIHTEATKLNDEAVNRDLTEEETTQQAERFSRMDRLQKQLDDSEKLAKYAFSRETPEVVKPQKSQDQITFEQSEKPAQFSADKMDRAEFGKALGQWALTGEMRQEYSAITTSTSSSALLPKVVTQPIVPLQGNAIRRGMAVVGATPLQTNSTAAFSVPVVIPSKGSALSESGTSGSENGSDGSAMVNKILLSPSPIQSGQVWVSNMELGALDYDLLESIVPGLDDAKEMQLESTIMAAIIADSGITQTVVLGGTAATDLTYPKFVDLNRKPVTRFDRLKVIFLSNDGFAAAEKLVGDDGHPILNMDPQNQGLYRFNGTPVIKSDYLESFGAVNKCIGVLISFVGFKLRDAGQSKIIRITNDRSYVDQTGLNEVGYHAYGYVVAACVKLLTAAS